MATVMLAQNFEPSKLIFSGLEKNRKGGKVIYIGLPDAAGQRQRITLQTPPLALPFGVSPYTEASTGEVQSYSLDVSYRGADTDPRVAEILAKMRALDEVLLDAAVENSKEWFGKKMSRDICAEFYRRLVKDSATPGQYPPVTKFKVQLSNGEPAAMFFDEERKPTTLEHFVKGSTCRCIIEVDRIWFVNKNFGVTWRLLQAACVSRPRRLDAFAFQDEADEPMDDAAPAPAAPAFVDDAPAAPEL